MSGPSRARLARTLAQVIEGELPHRLEESVSRAAEGKLGLDQALVDERGDAVEHLWRVTALLSTHGLGRRQVESVMKDRKPLEEALLAAAQEVVGPCDRRRQRLVPREGGA